MKGLAIFSLLAASAQATAVLENLDDIWGDASCAKSCASNLTTNGTAGVIGSLCSQTGVISCLSSSCPSLVPATVWPTVTSAVSVACGIYSTCSASPSTSPTFTITIPGDNVGTTASADTVTITGCPDIRDIWKGWFRKHRNDICSLEHLTSVSKYLTCVPTTVVSTASDGSVVTSVFTSAVFLANGTVSTATATATGSASVATGATTTTGTTGASSSGTNVPAPAPGGAATGADALFAVAAALFAGAAVVVML